MSKADREFHNARPGSELTFARVDSDYFTKLTELLNQATPEKPKGRMSRALGRTVAKLTGRKR